MIAICTYKNKYVFMFSSRKKSEGPNFEIYKKKIVPASGIANYKRRSHI
jgi:hypothetical protein